MFIIVLVCCRFAKQALVTQAFLASTQFSGCHGLRTLQTAACAVVMHKTQILTIMYSWPNHIVCRPKHVSELDTCLAQFRRSSGTFLGGCANNSLQSWYLWPNIFVCRPKHVSGLYTSLAQFTRSSGTLLGSCSNNSLQSWYLWPNIIVTLNYMCPG